MERVGQRAGRVGPECQFLAGDREAAGDHRGHRRDRRIPAFPAVSGVFQLHCAGEERNTLVASRRGGGGV